MTSLKLDGRLAGAVELDLCFPCQGLWFDDYESQQIAPGGIVELFRQVQAHRDQPRLPLADLLYCPRCHERLVKSLDVVKSGRFTYHRCLQKHGRFITFGQLMIEKGFVRQLTGAEIEALKARVSIVRCSACGAPVDIRVDAACSHCRAPIAILDPDAVDKALAAYRQAEIKRTTLDPEALAEAILSAERERSRRGREQTTADIGDLVGDGIDILWGLFNA